MMTVIKFLLSFKTVTWLFLAFIAIMFVGALSLSGNLSFFSGIDETPLFTWLVAAGDSSKTWWIYLLIAMLALLAASTIACTIDALVNRMGTTHLLVKLSPQIMHMGVLFIMLGHLLTASLGFKTDVLVKKNERTAITDTTAIYLADVSVWKDRQGYDGDWAAKIWWYDDSPIIQEKTIRPVHPRYFGQFGVYIKSVTLKPEVSALIRVCRDPGALWALIGGLLLSAGGAGFLLGRFSKQRQTGTGTGMS